MWSYDSPENWQFQQEDHILSKPHLIPHDSRLKTAWDLLVAVCVFVSALLIPYRMLAGGVAFDAMYGGITALLALDILLSFNTQARTGLRLLDDRRSVARHYLATWFVADLLAALPLAALALAAPDGDFAGSLPVRILPLLRLLRLLKIPSTLKALQDLIAIPPALMRLAVFLFWFALLAHFMSLGWLAIGAGELHRGFGDRYLRALYWCITTITTIGYGDYGPDHDANVQILYTIGVQIIGVGMFSYIIGNVATLIVNLDTARAEFRTRVEEVRNSMRIQRLPQRLQERVKHYYDYLWETRKGLSNDTFMRDLPETLRLEISLHLNRDILEKVALFKGADEVFVHAVVGKLEPMVFLPGDFIIRQGEPGSCMYFLSRGDVEVLADGKTVASLPEGSAFGETALLQGENRNASIRALAYCDVYRLSKASFDTLRAEFPDFDRKVQEIMLQRLEDKSHRTPA